MKIHPDCINLTVDVMIKCAGLTDKQTAICEQKAQSAAYRAAIEYAESILQPEKGTFIRIADPNPKKRNKVHHYFERFRR